MEIAASRICILKSVVSPARCRGRALTRCRLTLLEISRQILVVSGFTSGYVYIRTRVSTGRSQGLHPYRLPCLRMLVTLFQRISTLTLLELREYLRRWLEKRSCAQVKCPTALIIRRLQFYSQIQLRLPKNVFYFQPSLRGQGKLMVPAACSSRAFIHFTYTVHFSVPVGQRITLHLAITPRSADCLSNRKWETKVTDLLSPRLIAAVSNNSPDLSFFPLLMKGVLILPFVIDNRTRSLLPTNDPGVGRFS